MQVALAALLVMLAGAVDAAIVAEYRLDAAAWSGAAGEVVDSSGNGFNGVARQADTTDALMCRGADLTNTSTADYLDLDSAALDGLTDFTLMLWYQSTNNSRTVLVSAANAAEDDEVSWQMGFGDRLFPEIKNDSDGVLIINAVDDGGWHHMAWTRSGGTNCFFVDGVLQVCNNLTTGALNVDVTGFIVGQEQSDTGYNFRNDRGIEGLIDELYVFDTALNTAAIDQIRSNNLAGLNWDGSSRPCSALAPRAAWYFDAPAWTGAADEVQDSSGNDFHGNAVATDTTGGLVCRAADLSTAGTADYLSLDYQAMDGVTDFSVSLWVKSTNTANKALLSGARAGQANEIIFWFSSATVFRPYFGTNNAPIGLANIWDGGWHHLTWVRNGASNCLYVDGALQGCRNLTTATRNLDPGGLIVGQEQDSVGGSFVASQSIRGELDELLIFGQALSAAQVNSIYSNNLAGLSWDGTTRSCPVTGASVFTIIHDNAGIYCTPERIGVRAVDAGGNAVTSYANTVVLDTGTGAGSWTLDTGSGTLLDAVADDGLATYTFSAADAGEAWFNLSYPAGAALLDVEVFESGSPTIRDDDLEGILTFAPSGFTVTASALTNPPPSPVSDPLLSRTAGADFAVHLTAYGTTDDDPVCGVIEDYNGVKPVSIWQDWVDPGSGSVRASAEGNAVGASEALASVENVSFNNGQASVTAKYKDAGRLRLNFKDGAMRGATDAFVSRPASLRVVSVENAAAVPNPQAATASGPAFTPAGAGFSVTVDVLDAEGDRTPNFGLEASAEGLRLSAGNLVVPVGGRLGSGDDGVLGNAAAFVADALAGRFVNNAVYYDETGIVQLRADIADGSYLGAGNVTGPLSVNVGRFYPDYFELNASALASSCGTFAYMSAPHISVQAEVFARAATGTTTANYDTLLVGAAGVGSLQVAAEYMDNGTDLGSRFILPLSSWQQGNYSLNTSSGVFSRLGVPDGGFDALSVGLRVVDPLDNRRLNVLDMHAGGSGDCIAAGSCSAREIGMLDIYYGRLMVLPAQGPENEPLAVDLEAQVFAGGAFVEHTGDQCSTYAGANVTLSNYRGNLVAGDTVVTGPLASTPLVQGHADPTRPLLLSAPGFNSEGMVQVGLQVAPWLRYNWSGTGDEDPSADATFGRFRGHDRIIFWQQDP